MWSRKRKGIALVDDCKLFYGDTPHRDKMKRVGGNGKQGLADTLYQSKFFKELDLLPYTYYKFILLRNSSVSFFCATNL